MTSLYTAASAIRGHGAAGAASADKRPRYHLRAGLLYLHWSGGFLTEKRADAWSGTIEQARNCRRTFDAAAGCKSRLVTFGPSISDKEEVA